jgi:hypothetical protein
MLCENFLILEGSMSKLWKTIYETVAILFFSAATLAILIGAYAQSQIDIWIVAALAVMILWKVYDDTTSK